MDTQLPPPIWVDTPQGLLETTRILSGEKRIAVDTESNSLHAYQEQVCLIQFSIPGYDYLIDPMALPDISPLSAIFASDRIEKIFHASEYDVICLKRDYGIEFNRLFDTMVAARILGIHEVGLNNLLNTEFGINLDKRLQKANWGRRPLPEEYLAYARMDTHYLMELRDVLEDKLRAAGLWELAQEDFARMTRTTVPAENKIEDEIWRIHGARDLNPEDAAVFLHLLLWREEAANKANRPPFKIISNEQLLMIAQSKTCQMGTLRHKIRLSPYQLNKFAETIISVVEKGRKSSPLDPPRQHVSDPAFRKRLDRLKIFRKTAAEKMKVESDVILPRDLLYDLAQDPPRHWEDFSLRMLQYPWRYRTYGEQIFSAIHPRTSRGTP